MPPTGEGFVFPVHIQATNNFQQFAADVEATINRIKAAGGRVSNPATGTDASAREAARAVGAQQAELAKARKAVQTDLKGATATGDTAGMQRYKNDLKELTRLSRELNESTRQARTTGEGRILAPNAEYKRSLNEQAAAQKKADDTAVAGASKRAAASEQAAAKEKAAAQGSARAQTDAAKKSADQRVVDAERVRKAEDQTRKAAAGGAGGKPPTPPAAAPAAPPPPEVPRSAAANIKASNAVWDEARNAASAGQPTSIDYAKARTAIDKMIRSTLENTALLETMSKNYAGVIDTVTREKVSRRELAVSMERAAGANRRLQDAVANEQVAMAKTRIEQAKRFDVGTKEGFARTSALADANVAERNNNLARRNIEIGRTLGAFDPEKQRYTGEGVGLAAFNKRYEGVLRREISIRETELTLLLDGQKQIATEKVLRDRLNRAVEQEVRLQTDMVAVARSNAEKARAGIAQRRLDRAAETPADRFNIAQNQLEQAARAREIARTVRAGTDVGAVAVENADVARLRVAQKRADIAATTPGDRTAAASLAVEQRLANAQQKLADIAQARTVSGQRTMRVEQELAAEQAQLRADEAKLSATNKQLILATAEEANAREEQAARLVFARAGRDSGDLAGAELLARAAVLKRTVADNQRAAIANVASKEDIEAAAQKRLAEAKLRSAINSRERELIREQVKSGAVGGGNWFQRLQSALSPNSNKLPEENLKFGQFLGDKLQRTVGYAASGAILGGGIAAISSMVKDAAALEVGFVRLRGQLDGIGQSEAFPGLRDQIHDIAAETGQASADVQAFLSRMIGLDNDPAQALRDTESAMKLATVTGLDMKTMMVSIVPIQKAFGISAEEIGDEVVAMGEKFGIAEDDFVQFLGKTASVAKGAGLSFKEISVIGANLANSLGKPIDSASEAINKSFQQIDQNKEKILNILAQNPATSADVQPIIQDLGEGKTGQAVIGLLRASQRFNATQKDAILKNVVSRREAEEFNALIQNAGPILQQLGEAQENAGENSGKLEQRFRDLKDTVQVTFQTFKAAVESLGDALFRSGLSDILADIGNALKTVAGIMGFVFNVFGKLNEATTVFGVGILATIVKIVAMGAAFAKTYTLLVGLKDRNTEATVKEDAAETKNAGTKAGLTTSSQRAAAAEGELAAAKDASAVASTAPAAATGATGAIGGLPYIVSGGKGPAGAAAAQTGEKIALQAEGDAAAEVRNALVMRQLVAQRRNASAATSAAEAAKVAAIRDTAKTETSGALTASFIAKQRIKEATAEKAALVRQGIASEAAVPAALGVAARQREAEVAAAYAARSNLMMRVERTAPIPAADINRDILVQRFNQMRVAKEAEAATAAAVEGSAGTSSAVASAAAASPGLSRAARVAAVKGAVTNAWMTAGDAIQKARGVTAYDAKYAAAAGGFQAEKEAGTLAMAGFGTRAIAGGTIFKTPVSDARLDATGQKALGASPLAVTALVAAGVVAVKSAYDSQAADVDKAANDLIAKVRAADNEQLKQLANVRTDFWDSFATRIFGKPLAEDIIASEQQYRDTTDARIAIGAQHYREPTEATDVLGATKTSIEGGYAELYRKYQARVTPEQLGGLGTALASDDVMAQRLREAGIEVQTVEERQGRSIMGGLIPGFLADKQGTPAVRKAVITKENLPKYLDILRKYQMSDGSDPAKRATDKAVNDAIKEAERVTREGGTVDERTLFAGLDKTGGLVEAVEASGQDPKDFVANLTQLPSGGPSFKSLEELKKELAAGQITQNEFVAQSASTMRILESEASLFQGEAGERARLAFLEQNEFMKDLYEKQALVMADFASKFGAVTSSTPKAEQLRRHMEALKGARFNTKLQELPKVFDEAIAARDEAASRIADPFERAAFLNKPIELPEDAKATYIQNQINTNAEANAEARQLAEMAGMPIDKFEEMLSAGLAAGKTPEQVLSEYFDREIIKWDRLADEYEKVGAVFDAAMARANADELRRRKSAIPDSPSLGALDTGLNVADPNIQALNNLNAATEDRQAKSKVLAAIYAGNSIEAATIAANEADAAYLDALEKRRLGKATNLDVAAAEANKITADKAKDDANHALTRLKANRSVLAANGDPLGEANAALQNLYDERAYLASLGGRADPGAVEQNEQDIIRAQQNQAKVQLDVIRSGMSITDALIERNPLQAAQAALRRAEFEEQNAIGVAAQQEAAANRIRAQHGLEDALSRAAEARANLAIAIANANDDPVEAARIAAQEAQRKLDEAIARGVTDDETLAPLRANATTTQRELVRTQVQDQIDTIDFMQQMGQISMGQAITSLRAVLATVKVGSKEYEQLSLKIRQMTQSAQADLQFNLPSTLGLPTLYEARRSRQSYQQGIGYQDNRNVTVAISVNGAQDPAAVAAQVAAAFNSSLRGGATYTAAVPVGA